MSIREALGWSLVWVVLGLTFGGFVYVGYENRWLGLGLTEDVMTATPRLVEGVGVVYNDGASAAIKYITGYLVEKSLAVDNIFVIAMIFGILVLPSIYQHRVLFWGIVGALLMRGVMIAVGAQLIREFAWILYVFGAFLIVTGVKMLFVKNGHADPNRNLAIRLTRRLIPITEGLHGQHFFVRAGSDAAREPAVPGEAARPDRTIEAARPGALLATPLLLALIIVEVTDLIFAVDSIPAIFAITADPFLVFTSNVFAILGLRSLYFALAGMIDQFRYLKASLAFVLMIAGTKMMIHDWLKQALGQHFALYLLVVILLVLLAGVVASLRTSRPRQPVPGVQEGSTFPSHRG